MNDTTRTQLRRFRWDVFTLWMLLLASAGLVWFSVYTLIAPEDFTDTGVGCVEDCLEPTAFPIDYWEI